MSNLRNSVQLIGNVGQDVEVVELENGKKLVKFSLATNETYKDAKGEKVTNIEWHSLVAWNKIAEIVEKYVKKGAELAIQGKITYNKYEDKDGNKRSKTEIVVNEIVMLGSKE